VAIPVRRIAENPDSAYDYTAEGNLVAVISNGTAILGLGDLGALASKPVMEGKAVLFKKFAGIDVFDIEVNELDPDKLIEIIAALEPTFGGINLEDIKAPECFYIERTLRDRMKIPVFHDDQHGTAIIVGAAVLNGLSIVGKDIKKVKLVTSGAGAAALACLQLLVELGLTRENIWVTDIEGVVYQGRKALMDDDKAGFAQATSLRKLGEVIEGADVFLGLSAAGVLKSEMVKKMAARPLILALANPTPEIMPEQVKAVRADAIIATGRSDYVNQVNNVLCFPFIFRGALDVGATTITTAMETAAVRALAGLAREEQSDIVASAYGVADVSFGPEYLIPKPFDPRLITRIAPAVAQAAMASGVATRPIDDIQAYRDQLQQFVYHSGMIMKPLFSAAKEATRRRIVYAEGEDERVLRAAQVVVDEKLARPLLLGRPDVIAQRIEQFGLRLELGKDCEATNLLDPAIYGDAADDYHQLRRRDGVSRAAARAEMRSRCTLLAAMLVRQGRADAMLCGTLGGYGDHLRHVRDVIGLRPGTKTLAAMQMLMLPGRQLFICDTHVNRDPDAAQVAEIALLAAEEVRRFGVTPSVALLSHSNFGGSNAASAVKMREALALIQASDPQLAVEGEMRGDAALSKSILDHEFPDSALETEANVLIMPNVDAANISYNLLRMAAGSGITVGGILLGAARSVHILTPSSTVRRIVNMTALAVVDANSQRGAA
ncbi:MAG TPA: NADP-dependent malic enzyme, partial [Vineibacter sp.]|nr:NADP-dependent malic enzyme [Vineibacter sp.]